MLVKALGVIDFVAGMILIFGTSLNLPNQTFLVFGIILLAKSSLGFLKDVGSWIDLLTGLIFILSVVISVPLVINIIFGLLVIQKSIASFL